MRRRRPTETLAATDEWFLRNGLSYFVPEQRDGARAALSLRRTLPFLLLIGLAAAAVAVVLAKLAGEFSLAPAAAVTLGILAAVWYALTALNARPIVTWALSRTFGSVRTLLPMMSRALPLLLIFVTFLFINAEVWQVAASLDGGVLWLTVLLFALLSVAFLLVRLPEEVDRTDDDVDEEFLLRACTGTPLEETCRELVEDPTADPAAYAEVSGFERWNLVLVLVIVQTVQVLLLALSVFVFFLLFGSLVMSSDVVLLWLGEGNVNSVSWLPNVSAELVQVSVFLAAFSGLYLTVSTVTDDTYREQFFSQVQHQLERAVGVRAVYLAVRDRGDAEQAPDTQPIVAREQQT